MAPSEVIREIRRERLGLTQVEFARRLGVKDAQTVSNWERGVTSPSMPNLRRIAKLGKVSVADLFADAA